MTLEEGGSEKEQGREWKKKVEGERGRKEGGWRKEKGKGGGRRNMVNE